MKTFFVVCQEFCPTCQGSKVVPNPLWVRFFAETAGRGEEERWAQENGFDCALDLGPEEEPCQDCDAQGVIQRLVPLPDALQSLKVSVGPKLTDAR